MSNALKRRLDLLETNRVGGMIIVPQYVGMRFEDAMRIKFGDEGPPRNARLVIVENALPDDPDQPYDFGKLSPGEYEAEIARLADRERSR